MTYAADIESSSKEEEMQNPKRLVAQLVKAEQHIHDAIVLMLQVEGELNSVLTAPEPGAKMEPLEAAHDKLLSITEAHS